MQQMREKGGFDENRPTDRQKDYKCNLNEKVQCECYRQNRNLENRQTDETNITA